MVFLAPKMITNNNCRHDRSCLPNNERDGEITLSRADVGLSIDNVPLYVSVTLLGPADEQPGPFFVSSVNEFAKF